jgi:hypothetical protein
MPLTEAELEELERRKRMRRMEAYDRLPRELRAALQECDDDLDAHSIQASLKYSSVPKLLKTIKSPKKRKRRQTPAH